jgi:ketosteroid isomerase-like protein
MKVFAAHDLDRLVAACAEDGSVLASNAPIATGHDAIRKVFAEFFQLPGFKAEWHPTNVEVAKSGELGYTSGTYTLSFNDPSGNPINDRGKYVTVWRKRKDGAWKVVRDIFNSDLPAK